MEYGVEFEWFYTIEADSPQEAADIARRIQLDPENKVRFNVYDDTGEFIKACFSKP